MSANPLIFPRFRALDANGAPLAGGLLYTYAAGTTTPQPTYTDSSGSIANSNPVVLDAAGYADVWLSSTLGNYKFVLQNASAVVQWTVDNFPPSGGGSSGSNAGAQDQDPGGRLTLTAGVPVTTSDVTGAATVYYAPYKHDQVPLFDGTAWALYSIGSGISQALSDNTKSPAAAAATTVYDLFVWNDSGTIRLSRGFAWTSQTARGTGVGTAELTTQNGKYVNKQLITNGPAALTGLYVGTVYVSSLTQVNDSNALRNVWNNYNRIPRTMLVLMGGGNYPYATGSYRQANGSTSNQLAMVIGLDEDEVTASVIHSAFTTSGAGTVATAIGLDSATTPAGACSTSPVAITTASSPEALYAQYSGHPGIGSHFLAWLEYGAANVQFTGTTSPPLTQTSIRGTCRA